MKWVLIIASLFAAMVLIVVITGYLLPVKHTASVTISVAVPATKVWQKLTDIKHYPEWRTELKSINLTSDTSWVEIPKNGNEIPISITELHPVTKIVTSINGKDLPFGGSWIFSLESHEDHTNVTIIENGEVYNPVFRFVSRFIMGHDTTLKKYANDLESYFKNK